jgi:predicted metalloprotease with PDZ domain
MKKLLNLPAIFALLSAVGALAQSAARPIHLAVDLTDAPRRILHATETIPLLVSATEQPLTLVYPKWIPGEHAPSGPIQNQAGFVIEAREADGKRMPVKWARDFVDLFSYHLVVPAGATELEISADYLDTSPATGFSGGASSSVNLAVLSWNTVLVYPSLGVAPASSAAPAVPDASTVFITPSIKLPEGWKFATALESISASSVGGATFKPVSLEQLVDSPVLAGRWFREIALAPEIVPKHFLDMVGDGPEDLEISQEHIDQFSKLVRETGPLFKARHYGSYHFLVTLSDQVAHFGLEHAQSSDNRLQHQGFTDDSMFVSTGLLLPHEFTHSWNGKYRRPAGLATANSQEPMKDNLLWVYEGLTEYLGDVLAARSGIWAASVYRDRLATYLAQYDQLRPGRTWRDLQDTATFSPVLSFEGGAYDNWRRGTDYYDEGELLWLEVDLTLRAKTKGAKSLNDFAAAFFGVGGNTGPRVLPYHFDDVVKALNELCPMDWAAFLRARLDANTERLPELAGIDALSGYTLSYADKPNYWSQLMEYDNQNVEVQLSLGMTVDSTGRVTDVIMHGLAYSAGFAPGMRIVAVNGRAFATNLLRAAITDAKGTGPAIMLITENAGYYKMIPLEYHGGMRYPQLERVAAVPARLDDILQPMTK